MNRKERRAAGRQGQGGAGGSDLFALAVREHQAGRFAEAEQLYRRVLAGDRDHVASLHHLGIMALQRGEPQAAVDWIGRAIALNAHAPEFRYNLAFALQSLGRLSEAAGHYRAAVDIKPDYAEALTNLGNVLMQMKQPGEAVDAYRRVVALRPAPEARFNLANALAQAKSFDEAAAEYRQVLALKPDLLGAYNNFAITLVAQERYAEAIEQLQRALALNPRYVEAHVDLGNILQRQGRLDEAATQFERALAIEPNSADAHSNRGNVHLAQGQLDQAAASLKRALAIKPDLAEANNNFGIVLSARGHYAEAIGHFERALARKPDFVDACNNIARACIEIGQGENALGALRRALSIDEQADTKSLFVKCLRQLPAPPNSDDMRALIARALSEPWGRPSSLAPVVIGLLKQTGPVAAATARADAAWPRLLNAEALCGAEGLAAIAGNELLCRLLELAPVEDVALERLLTNVRAILLGAAMRAVSSPDIFALACALARQCFINGYVYRVTGDETNQAQGLRDKVSASLAAGADIPEFSIAVLASYVPLGALDRAESLLKKSWSEMLDAVLTQQLREPVEEAALRAAIAALTPIDDVVSRSVQSQYEESPYPCWTQADPPGARKRIDEFLRSKFPSAKFQALGKDEFDALIAGCGTGQHAIEATSRLAGARVLAVDLSKASLAYAMRKTSERGISNIDYAQADILQLGSLGRSFDVIESSGVLHHLGDPFAGWRVLLSLLRPGGFMAVGLYSEIARADIVKARNLIAERGYRPTADDIRRFRQDLMAGEQAEAFRRFFTSGDFFSIAGCRDLLFHVQEHRMTLPQIGAFLRDNNLDLVGFELEGNAAALYRRTYPADETMTDLASWDAFEREFPATFAGMYQFWVQKRA